MSSGRYIQLQGYGVAETLLVGFALDVPTDRFVLLIEISGSAEYFAPSDKLEGHFWDALE